jgi:hypothetical protein
MIVEMHSRALAIATMAGTSCNLLNAGCWGLIRRYFTRHSASDVAADQGIVIFSLDTPEFTAIAKAAVTVSRITMHADRQPDYVEHRCRNRWVTSEGKRASFLLLPAHVVIAPASAHWVGRVFRRKTSRLRCCGHRLPAAAESLRIAEARGSAD